MPVLPVNNNLKHLKHGLNENATALTTKQLKSIRKIINK